VTPTRDTRYAFLFDAPDFTGASFPDGAPDDIDIEEHKPPTSVIQIAKTGSFKHPRYGAFKVTKDTFDGLIHNLTAVSGGEVAMDFDHEPDYGGSTRACGWIKTLEADGSKLMASVEWTWRGAWAIKDQEYKYISPTWVLDYVDDSGEKRGPVLLGAALTNRPFFERMAVVTCSRTFNQDDLVPALDDTPAVAAAPSEQATALFESRLAVVLARPGMDRQEQALRAQFERDHDSAFQTINHLLTAAG
jgi:Mu-like prophage I protein